MKKGVGLLVYISIFFLLFSYTSCYPQSVTENYILLSGEIISPAGTPIEGVHILNTNTNQLSVSDENGFFSLTMYKSHILRFSAVGFRTYYFTLKPANKENVIYKRITLQTITIGLKNIDIVAKEEPRSENLFKPKPLSPSFVFGYQGEQHEVKPNLGNPVSLLYDWLSKEGKQKRQLEELLKQEDIRKLVAARYESDIIWELTGYTGAELESFKEYCNLSDYFVTHASDYDFLLHVKSCFNTYEPKDN